MAKPTGGLLAFSATGSVAKTIVFSKWRGRAYVRQHVIPANPKSAAQTETRTTFSWLQAVWKVAGSVWQAPWTAYALGQPLTNRNAWSMFNLPKLRGQANLNSIVMSPGSGGGLAVTGLTATPGANTITLAATAPTPPTGWTLSGTNYAVIADQSPSSGTLYNTSSVFVASGTTSAVISGLTSGTEYHCGAWPTWGKPGGTTAYGPSLVTSATPT